MEPAQNSPRGVKHNSDKPRATLLPWDVLLQVSRVFEFGARKYARNNWRGGMPWSDQVDAAARHLERWLEGEDSAKDSGLHHIDHAITDLLMLRWYILHRVGEDDRWDGTVPEVRPDQ